MTDPVREAIATALNLYWSRAETTDKPDADIDAVLAEFERRGWRVCRWDDPEFAYVPVFE